MKIGILILAHSNASQLKMLVDCLKQDFVLFIHLDVKSDIPSDFFKGEDNVFVVKKYRVHWGSFNMILATLDLFRLAYNHACDYYMLISGSDLPLKKNKDIISHISLHPTTNYLTSEKMPRAVWPLNGGLDRLQLYWENINNQNKPTLLNLLCGLGRRLQRHLGLKRKLYPIDFYGGANWVNLSKETVDYILQYIAMHPDYLLSFRYTRNADEIWLQTLVMNSPYGAQTQNDNKRYIDWKSGPDYPRTLRSCDYEKLKASDAFFARKFDISLDKVMILKIIENR